MNTLYLDCSMGVAGNMLTSALYELLDDSEKINFMEQMNSIGLPRTVVSVEKVKLSKPVIFFTTFALVASIISFNVNFIFSLYFK